MRKKKLLFMEDLLQFFQENNLTKFSSSDSGYKLCVQIPATFEVEDEVDDDHRGMMRLKFRIFHLDENRNGSFVSKKAAKAAMPTIKNRPVMAYIHQRDDGEWDFETHNMTVETDDDGNNYFEYQEKQVGSFDESEPFFEYDEKLDKTYVCAYAYISENYTRACDILRRKGGTKNSVELTIEELAYNAKEGWLELQKFYVSASTLLGSYDDGTEVNEGMLGSRADIVDFSESNNSVLANRKELINEIANAVVNQLSDKLTVSSVAFSEEGGKPKLDKFNELLEKYNKTVEDIDFEYENLTDEELESKFAELFDDDGDESSSEDGDGENVDDNHGDEPEDNVNENIDDQGNNDANNEPEDDDTNNGQQSKKSYSVEYSVKYNGEIRNFSTSLIEKLNALYELVNSTYGESDNAWYDIDAYDDEKIVLMHDYWGGKHYRQSYQVKKDVYSLKGDRIEVFCTYLTKDEQEQLNSMKSNYAEVSDKLSKYESEPEKMEILNSDAYANIANQKDFEELKKQENHFDFTVEEVQNKADVMLLQYAKSGKLNFAAIEQPKTNEEPKKDFFAFAKVEHNSSFLDGLLKRK